MTKVLWIVKNFNKTANTSYTHTQKHTHWYTISLKQISIPKKRMNTWIGRYVELKLNFKVFEQTHNTKKPMQGIVENIITCKLDIFCHFCNSLNYNLYLITSWEERMHCIICKPVQILQSTVNTNLCCEVGMLEFIH